MASWNKRFNGIGYGRKVSDLERNVQRHPNFSINAENDVFYKPDLSEPVCVGTIEPNIDDRGCRSRIVKNWHGKDKTFEDVVGVGYQKLRRHLHPLQKIQNYQRFR